MTTHQALTGGTLAYNNRAMWQRHHGTRFWWLSVDNKQPCCHAVIDDFGALIPVPWSLT